MVLELRLDATFDQSAQIDALKRMLSERVAEGIAWTLANYQGKSFSFLEREIDAHMLSGDLAFAAGALGALRIAQAHLPTEPRGPLHEAVELADGSHVLKLNVDDTED